MNQYLSLCHRIINEGVWVENERTGKRCLTVINADFEYDVANGEFPLDTTRKSFWKAAVAEMLGYLRGYRDAEQFKQLGAPTWHANANKNKDWLANPARQGDNDMGWVYGAMARNWPKPDGGTLDLLDSIVKDLSRGVDNRGEILTFLNPGAFHLGCLRPCMYSHHFSLLDGTLYLNSTQRSIDVPLGLNFNMVQCYFLLAIMAQITGNKPGKVYHKLINCHIYEDQLELMRDIQLQRDAFSAPTFHVNPDITSLHDLETWVSLDDFEVKDYQHHDAIKYPFTV